MTAEESKRDSELHQRAGGGEPEAFEPIVEHYRDAVFGIALERLKNFHEPEDGSETALAAVEPF